MPSGKLAKRRKRTIRGYRFGNKANKQHPEIRDPEFYVFPVEVVKQAQNIGDKWSKIRITKVPEYEKYKSNWSLIAAFLRS